MGMFGKSFEEQVKEALVGIQAKVPGVINLHAEVDGKVVTLKGQAATKEAKTQVMHEFIALVKAENTVNMITLDTPAATVPIATAAYVAPAAPAAAERIHLVVSGDTLSGISKTYYGKAGLYMKIFEANKDQLKDPNVIKVGQVLRIPD